MLFEQSPHPFEPDAKVPEDVDDLIFLWETETFTPSNR